MVIDVLQRFHFREKLSVLGEFEKSEIEFLSIVRSHDYSMDSMELSDTPYNQILEYVDEISASVRGVSEFLAWKR